MIHQDPHSADATKSISRILIVDDDPSIVRLLRIFLEDEGYDNVDGVTAPLQAMEALRNSRYDLLIIDLNMPEMNGDAVIRALQDEPDTFLPPVIMLTGRGEDEYRRRAESLGIREYIVKPFELDDMLDTVCRCLHPSATIQRNTPN